MQATEKFAAYDGVAVWGVGNTPEAALRDAREWVDKDTADSFVASLKTAKMTPALVDQVEAGGAAGLFGLIPGGRLGSKEEVLRECK